VPLFFISEKQPLLIRLIGTLSLLTANAKISFFPQITGGAAGPNTKQCIMDE
jgi:hypothetical protein